MMETIDLSKKRKVTREGTLEGSSVEINRRVELSEGKQLFTPAQRLFISAIQTNSQEDLIKCLPQLTSSIDLMFASFFCIMFDWRDALKVLVAIPLMKQFRCLDKTYPMNEFYWEYFYEKSIYFFTSNNTDYLFFDALMFTMRLNNPKCFEILLDGHVDPLFSKYRIRELSKAILEEVLDPSGDAKATEKLQCAYFKPLMIYALRCREDFWEVCEMFSCVLERKNETVAELLFDMPEYKRKLSQHEVLCHHLAARALYEGNKKLARQIFALVKTRSERGAPHLLKAAMEADDLDLIENVMKIDAPIMNFHITINPFVLYEYMKERGKAQLFRDSCPTVLGLSD